MVESFEITIPVATPGPDGEARMPATLVRPGTDMGAGIVLVQEIFGRSDYMRQRAVDLAEQGYNVLLPQVFWRMGVDTIPEDSPDALNVAMGHVQALDWDQAIADLRNAITWLRDDPESEEAVALVGFCFGGGLAYATLQGARGREHADGLVSYYGSALPQLVDGATVHAASLHHFGDADAWIPAEAIEHIREVVEREGAEFHLWTGANHAFDNPSPELGLHDPRASREAWEVTLDWLAEHHPEMQHGGGQARGSTCATSWLAAFHAEKPPSRWATESKPMSCSVLAVSAERQPDPQ